MTTHCVQSYNFKKLSLYLPENSMQYMAMPLDDYAINYNVQGVILLRTAKMSNQLQSSS